MKDVDVAFARAVERAVERNAPKIRRAGRHWRCSAWWRDGKDLNVSVDVESGFWRDWATGETGGAKELAAKMGQSMPDFMNGITTEKRPPPPPPVEREGVADCWRDLRASMRVMPRLASLWLERTRGFPADVVTRIPHVTLTERNVGCFDFIGLNRWAAARVAEHGPHIVAPLVDAGSGEVRNLQLRPLTPGRAEGDSRRWIPGCLLGPPSTPFPRGYGDPHRIHRASTVVVCEGFADTAFARAALLDHDVAVVGASSASTVAQWGGILSTVSPDVVVVAVPQLDPPRHDRPKNPGEESQRAFAALVASLRRLDVKARFFDWDRFLPLAPASKDLGDVLQAVGYETARAAFVEILGAA